MIRQAGLPQTAAAVVAAALLTVLAFLPAPAEAAAGDLVISEFLASNDATLDDEDGDSSDWFELHNTSAAPIDVGGWHVSDDSGNLTRWTFPSRTIAAGEFLVVFASGKNRLGAELHTDFKLSAGGEYLALVEPDGTTIASEYSPEYPQQFTDVAYGRDADGVERFYPTPTPGAANGVGVAGLVDELAVSVARGFFDAPFQFSLSTPTVDADIHYTLDGSEPDETSEIYTGPVTVSSTTTLRATAVKADFLTAPTVTQTYVFLADVLQQPAVVTGYPNNTYATGNGPPVPHDNEMDPDVVNDPVYGPLMLDAMRDIPTMSIVADPADIFGDTGFYDGEDVEKPVSVEVLYPDDPASSHQSDAGIESHSHDRLKRSLRLNFRGEYGASRFETDLFQRAALNGESASNEVKRIILRGGNNRAWSRTWNPDKTAFIEDQFYRDTQLALSGVGAHGNFVHLYINGIYWGLYNPTERPDEHFTSEYFGGDDEDWYYRNHGGATDGDPTRYDYLTGTLVNEDMSMAATYAELQEYVDIDRFIDYLLTGFYIGLSDWPLNNWYYGHRNPSSPLGSSPGQFYSWDGEWSFDVRNGAPAPGGAWVNPAFRNGSTSSGVIAQVWRAALGSDEFRMRFVDRADAHLHGDGGLSDAAALARWNALADVVELAVIGESARWGDSLESLGQPLRTRDVDWQREVDDIAAILDGNAAVLLAALRAEGYYPASEPPTFNQDGGVVEAGFGLVLLNPNPTGTIYYTTDGSDPRAVGGGVATSALPYTDALPLTEATTFTMRANVDGEWTPARSASFEVVEPDAPGLTVLSGPCVVYDSDGAGELPFVGGEVRSVQVTGALSGQGGAASCVPAGASSVVFTISSIDPLTEGNLLLTPAGVAATGAAGVVNYGANNGLNNANTVTVPVSSSGAVDIEANTGPAGAVPTTDVRLVAIGYYSPDVDPDLKYFAVNPCPVADSRVNQGANDAFDGPNDDGLWPVAGAFPDIDVLGTFPAGQGGGQTDCGVPDTADAVLLNVVAVNMAGGSGHLSVGTGGADPIDEAATPFAVLTPKMNNGATTIVNVGPGGTVAIDIDGDVGASTMIRVEVLGYFDDDESGFDFFDVTPCAVFDTRSDQGAANDFEGLRKHGVIHTTTYQVAGDDIDADQGGVVDTGGGEGSCGVPDGASAVLINLEGVNAVREGNFWASAAGTTTTGGVLNFNNVVPKMNNANAVVVPLNANGELALEVNAGNFTPIGTDVAHARGVILGYYI